MFLYFRRSYGSHLWNEICLKNIEIIQYFCRPFPNKETRTFCYSFKYIITRSYFSWKATRKICGAVKSGVREFSETGFKVITGKAISLHVILKKSVPTCTQVALIIQRLGKGFAHFMFTTNRQLYPQIKSAKKVWSAWIVNRVTEKNSSCLD